MSDNEYDWAIYLKLRITTPKNPRRYWTPLKDQAEFILHSLEKATHHAAVMSGLEQPGFHILWVIRRGKEKLAPRFYEIPLYDNDDPDFRGA